MQAVKCFVLTTVLLFGTPAISFAMLPYCQSADSDVDGDGFGWEDDASCRVVVAASVSGTPECSNALLDPDGDGYGWENNATCVVASVASTSSSVTQPICSNPSFDTDGDGYGWENGATCLVNVNSSAPEVPVIGSSYPTCGTASADPDGDGFGWENNSTCIVGTITEPSAPVVRPLSDSYPYRVSSPFAGQLKPCALIEDIDNSCTLQDLSFIGAVSTDPSIDDIMNRVLVTHDWMGARFEQLLNNAPPDLIRMFQSLAVIVIGSDINPASYSILNARLSIDPYYLWMTVDEKRTIDTTPDFRTDFGNDLQFEYFRAYQKPNGDFIEFLSLLDDSEREFADIVEPAMSLFYHELAHAVDFAPPWTLANMNGESTIFNAILDNEPNWLSPLLQSVFPMQSTDLIALAGVRFFDDEPTIVARGYRSTEVGARFANDGAVTFYSYSTIREDFANLVEVAMMKYGYDLSLGIYFYDKPTDSDPTCIVGWGAMNRIGNPSVIPRAEWAVNRSVGTGPRLDAFFAAGTGSEVPDRVGQNLCSDAKAKDHGHGNRHYIDRSINPRSVE